MIHIIFIENNTINLHEMDQHTAASIIQRWFRSKLATKECTISHSSYMSCYEVILDKQSYNANEMFNNMKYSIDVPHSRRQLTEQEMLLIHAKYDPFNRTYSYNKNDDDDIEGSSPKPPLNFTLNRNSILCLS